MFREINEIDLEAVTGGHGAGGLGNPSVDGPGTIGETAPWDSEFARYLWGPSQGPQAGIVVTATWISVDLGGDDEARIYEDGSIGLFRDGVYLQDIRWADGTSTTRDDSGNGTISPRGVGAGFDDGDSNSINWVPADPPSDPY